MSHLKLILITVVYSISVMFTCFKCKIFICKFIINSSFQINVVEFSEFHDVCCGIPLCCVIILCTNRFLFVWGELSICLINLLVHLYLYFLLCPNLLCNFL